jgi:glycosyl transferase family 25
VRALVINLASAGDRLALQAAQMRALRLPWERIEAVTPATLTPPATDPVWHRWQRPLRATEMALLASHRRAWERVAGLAEPCLVLEDDALLSASVPAFLAEVAPLSGVDHISLETRGRKKTVARVADRRAPMRRLWQDRTGSAAYVVWPSGAAKLIAHAARQAGPSDAIISATYTLRSFQADPALAIQLDRCAMYGVAQPLPTSSSIDALRKPEAATAGYSTPARAAFRLRRLAAQVRMGARQWLRPLTTARRHIPPDGAWPALDLAAARQAAASWPR